MSVTNASLISISAQQSKHWCIGPLVAPRGPSCSVSKYTWVMLRFQASLSLLTERGRCPVRHAAPPSHPLSFVLISAFSAATNAACARNRLRLSPKKQKQNMTKDAHSPSVHCLSVCLSSLSDWKRHRGRSRRCFFSLSEKWVSANRKSFVTSCCEQLAGCLQQLDKDSVYTL